MIVADIGDRVENSFAVFFNWLPHLVGAVLVLVVGYFIAKLVGGIVGRVLHRGGLDRAVHGGPGGTFVQKVTASPARLIGTLAFWAVFLGAISLAVSVLGIDALKDFVAAVFAYLPNVIAAVLIFLVAGALAAGVAGLVGRVMGDTPLGKIVATAVPILIMAIAGFMILDQLEIANTIVTITYAAILGAIALGSALAFGLGGREIAGQMLQGAYEKGQENKEQFKRDLDEGMQRSGGEVERMKDGVGGDSETEVVFEPDVSAPPPRAT